MVSFFWEGSPCIQNALTDNNADTCDEDASAAAFDERTVGLAAVEEQLANELPTADFYNFHHRSQAFSIQITFGTT